MSRATCRGTQTRGVVEVVNDEPARGGEVNDERHDEPRDKPRGVGEVVDDEPARGGVVDDEWRDEPRDAK
jgi:hypothetical protein